RAMTAWYHGLQDTDPADALVVVRQYEIEFVRPFTRERGELVVEVSLRRRGTTSAVFAFRCLSYPEGDEGPEVLHAHGTRVIVKVTPTDLRPAPWPAKYLTDYVGGRGRGRGPDRPGAVRAWSGRGPGAARSRAGAVSRSRRSCTCAAWSAGAPT